MARQRDNGSSRFLFGPPGGGKSQSLFPQNVIGYSDHTEGIDCAVSAANDYRACWIEKHFTLDKTLAGPDHRWSADPKEMAELVRCLKR